MIIFNLDHLINFIVCLTSLFSILEYQNNLPSYENVAVEKRLQYHHCQVCSFEKGASTSKPLIIDLIHV